MIRLLAACLAVTLGLGAVALAQTPTPVDLPLAKWVTQSQQPAAGGR